MRLKLTKAQRTMLDDIASLTSDDNDARESLPTNPTLYGLVYGGDSVAGVPAVVEMSEPEWATAIGDCLTYHEGRAADNLLEAACAAAGDARTFRRLCEIEAGLISAE